MKSDEDVHFSVFVLVTYVIYVYMSKYLTAIIFAIPGALRHLRSQDLSLSVSQPLSSLPSLREPGRSFIGVGVEVGEILSF